jgi:phospholipase C
VTHDFDPNGHRAMGYYDQRDLPYYYELATQFATSDRWYSPLLANTVPNRMYMFAGTSYGTTYPENPGPGAYDQKTIFQLLTENHVSWRYYYQDDSVFLAKYSAWATLKGNVYPISDYFSVLASATADRDLPQVIFIERGGGAAHTDEHPENNVQKGAAAVSQMINALMASSAWQDSAFILTFDECGGLYDHVPPQAVPKPDDVAPIMTGMPFTILPGDFDVTGFRIPLIVVSPWVKPHYTSHTVRDFTAVLKFIETRFNLPPLTRRDAGMDDMTEFFDFSSPQMLTPPSLPTQPTNALCDAKAEANQ